MSGPGYRVRSPALSAQALKKPHAPQTAAAGFAFDVAILCEFFRLHIDAGRQPAADAKRVVVGDDALAEGAETGVVPDLQNVPIRQVRVQQGFPDAVQDQGLKVRKSGFQGRKHLRRQIPFVAALRTGL